MPAYSHKKQFVVVAAPMHNEVLSLHMLRFPPHILVRLQFKSVPIQTPCSFVGNRVWRYVRNKCEDVAPIGKDKHFSLPTNETCTKVLLTSCFSGDLIRRASIDKPLREAIERGSHVS